MEDNFNSVQMKLNNKIEDYLLEILNKFNDNFIEFDERQQEIDYQATRNAMELDEIRKGERHSSVRLRQALSWI